MPLTIEGFSEEHLLKVAANNVQKKTSNSIILDRAAEDRIPKFSLNELTLGRVLGRGGFCVVNEITNIALREASGAEKNPEKIQDEGDIHNIVQDRNFMETHCIRQGRDCRYAIKILQDASKKDTQTFVNGVVDLAIEARFLSVVRHPNVIKMRAMSSGSPYDSKFFLVLDRLYDILTTRLVKWKKQQPKGMRKLMDRGGKKEIAFWVERCTTAYDMACALKYLHDLHIIYRDLKPDNVGFDVRGDVKIFDLGLAKEFDPDKRAADGTFQLTGDTGSPRYMANEVALNQPYNERCDVYSFSILLWQILELDVPYSGFTMSMFRKKVFGDGMRPRLDPKWSKPVSTALRTGWGPLNKRPSMETMCDYLRQEIVSLSGEELADTFDSSRRSEMSLHKASGGS